MNKIENISLANATGKIDYPLTNDYMFRAVLQENENVLKGLICSLLHLKPKDVKSVVITNPIIPGKHIDDRMFVLDVNVLLNNEQVINLEMQVASQSFWADRSLSYLCGLFNNLGKSVNYSKVKPACHIGILAFTPFPAYPEFYASNMMMNIKKRYIYNDKFILNVLDLTQIHLATDEDKAHKIDYWAKIFKASTWEDFKMLAQEENVFEEAYNAVFRLNQNEEVRYICEMREEGRRIMNTYEYMLDEERRIMNTYKDKLKESQHTVQTYEDKLKESQRTVQTYEDKLKESQHTVQTYEDKLKESQHTVQTYEDKLKESQHTVQTYEDKLKESQHTVQTYEDKLKERLEELAQKEAALVEKDADLAKQQAIIDKLQAELMEYRK